MLAEKRLRNETQLARGESTIPHVTAVEKVEAIWTYPLVERDRVPIDAVVDSGSESTIISRHMLHRVFRHCHQNCLSLS